MFLVTGQETKTIHSRNIKYKIWQLNNSKHKLLALVNYCYNF